MILSLDESWELSEECRSAQCPCGWGEQWTRWLLTSTCPDSRLSSIILLPAAFLFLLLPPHLLLFLLLSLLLLLFPLLLDVHVCLPWVFIGATALSGSQTNSSTHSHPVPACNLNLLQDDFWFWKSTSKQPNHMHVQAGGSPSGSQSRTQSLLDWQLCTHPMNSMNEMNESLSLLWLMMF